MVLKAMLLMVQITRSIELKDLQQRTTRAQEHQQKRHEKLDEFQEIGSQLAIKAIATPHDIQDNRQLVKNKACEEHPIQQTLTNCQSITSKVQLQVREIAQQFEDFKDRTSAHTLST